MGGGAGGGRHTEKILRILLLRDWGVGELQVCCPIAAEKPSTLREEVVGGEGALCANTTQTSTLSSHGLCTFFPLGKFSLFSIAVCLALW